VTHSNAELARRAVGDLGALFELLDPDIVWDNERRGPIDQRGSIVGKPAVVESVKQWVGTWADYRFTAEEIVAAGEHVVLVVRESGVGRTSGVPMAHRHCYVWTFRDGRIVRGTTYETKAEALDAVARSRTT
jgi:ketosteroid isomerase-like protein